MTTQWEQVYADIQQAREQVYAVARTTRLVYSDTLSRRYDASIYLKRELDQRIGAYKIRGAYNRLCRLSEAERQHGVVTASAGNHAQGVAIAAAHEAVKAIIVLPQSTSRVKVEGVERFGLDPFGRSWVEIKSIPGDFDDCHHYARQLAARIGATFIEPFDDPHVIAGQGTVGLEILADLPAVDDVVCAVGGGGLITGVGVAIKTVKRTARLYGAEALGATAMTAALKAGRTVTLAEVDPFVEGAAVRRCGSWLFPLARQVIDHMAIVSPRAVCQATLELWRDGIQAELAGALPVAALEPLRSRIKGRTVVCVIGGGNLSQADFLARVVTRAQAAA